MAGIRARMVRWSKLAARWLGERLHDATEAFELAERQEKEIEADYEAWRLLLDQMKAADAAQASNLGQTLARIILEFEGQQKPPLLQTC